MLIASTQNRTLDEAKLLSENHRGIFYSVGYHPKYAEIFEKSVLEEFIALSEYNFYFGIGGQISYDIKPLKDFVKKHHFLI